MVVFSTALLLSRVQAQWPNARWLGSTTGMYRSIPKISKRNVFKWKVSKFSYVHLSWNILEGPPSPQTQLSPSLHILFILMKIDRPAGGGLIELFPGKWWMLCHICHKRFTKKLRVNSILLQKILQRTGEVHTLFLLWAQNNLNYGIWKWRWQKKIQIVS